MRTREIVFTSGETAMLRKLVLDALRVARGDLKSYNYCRRAAVIISKAERRNARPKTNKPLLDSRVLEDIFAQ